MPSYTPPPHHTALLARLQHGATARPGRTFRRTRRRPTTAAAATALPAPGTRRRCVPAPRPRAAHTHTQTARKPEARPVCVHNYDRAPHQGTPASFVVATQVNRGGCATVRTCPAGYYISQEHTTTTDRVCAVRCAGLLRQSPCPCLGMASGWFWDGLGMVLGWSRDGFGMASGWSRVGLVLALPFAPASEAVALPSSRLVLALVLASSSPWSSPCPRLVLALSSPCPRLILALSSPCSRTSLGFRPSPAFFFCFSVHYSHRFTLSSRNCCPHLFPAPSSPLAPTGLRRLVHDRGEPARVPAVPVRVRPGRVGGGGAVAPRGPRLRA